MPPYGLPFIGPVSMFDLHSFLRSRFRKEPQIDPTDPDFVFDSFSIYRHKKPIIENLSVSFSPGSLTAIVGPNGGGKSTLLELMADPIHKKTTGVYHRGVFPRRLTGYLPQKSEAKRFFPLSVKDIVSGGLWHELGPFLPMRAEHFKRVREVIQRVGLQGYSYHTMNKLSGGQFQRALFARLAIQDPTLLLMDEPFNGIDENTQKDLLVLFQQWHAQKKTIIAIMHDLNLVRRFFPQTLLLARDYHIFGKTEEVLQTHFFEEAIRRSKTWELQNHEG